MAPTPLIVLACAAGVACFSFPPLPRLARGSAPLRSAAYEVDGKPISGPLKPLGNFVLVKVKEAEDQTSGGLFMPDKAKEKPTEGLIVDVGPGRAHPETGVVIPPPVSAGDTVLYGKYDGTIVDYNGEEHMLIRDENVLLKWDGGEMTVDAVTPVWDRILIKTEGVGEETSSGLALAASAASQARITFGEVIAAGAGMVSANGDIAPMDVAVGEFVKYRDYGGAEVEIAGEDYMIIKMSDCLCKWSAAP